MYCLAIHNFSELKRLANNAKFLLILYILERNEKICNGSHLRNLAPGHIVFVRILFNYSMNAKKKKIKITLQIETLFLFVDIITGKGGDSRVFVA